MSKAHLCQGGEYFDFNCGQCASVRIDTLESQLAAAQVRVTQLEKFGSKINDIRDSIVGYQKMSFSAHVYPMVAALDEAGFEGVGYEKAREMAQTQIERIADLEQQLAAHVQTIREREEQLAVAEQNYAGVTEAKTLLFNSWQEMRRELAKMREALKWVSHNALWASQQSSEESVVSYLIAIMNRAETALDKATAEKEAK